MKPTDIALAVFIAFMWGTNVVICKPAVADMPPIILMAIRFAVVALLVIPFVQRPSKKDLKQIAEFSLLMGLLHYSLFYTGLQGLDAGTTTLVAQAGVPFSAIISWIFLKEKLTPIQMAGIGIALLGVLIISGQPRVLGNMPFLLAVLAGEMVWVFGNFKAKKLSHLNVITMNGWASLFAAIQLVIASFFLESNQIEVLQSASWYSYGAAIYLAVFSTIIAYSLWYHLVHKYTVNTVTPIALLAPVFGVVAGVIFLGEPLTWQNFVGGIIIIAGVAAILLKHAKVVETGAEL